MYQRRTSKQAMLIAINKLESLKSQTTTGSGEEAYYQTIIDRYNEIMTL
jgi:hypothetical protein